MGITSGAFRLFRVAGIDVFLHWSWLVVAYILIRNRSDSYTSQVWNVAEYLAIFGIVLLHEFGHALACRQVGGKADKIVLWPLGGIAYVQPPARPGAMLWSIAAGPLVNVVLVPVTYGIFRVARSEGWELTRPDVFHFLMALTFINAGLLVFNLLPIYPLDGGQIVYALLWFVIGRAKSLLVVSVLGLAAGLGLVGVAVWLGDIWLGLIAAFATYRSAIGFQQARLLARVLATPRHQDAACPSCGEAPFQGDFWLCDHCRTRFDTFQHAAQCPQCGMQFPITACSFCGKGYPMAEFYTAAKAR
ncbi:MAG TPA: M50 family metallopeptidase [Gemmataceae bacterium]|jgi:Zn-dependent protease|nr:M50 family metallopeptidase [Gemmataceae bacterium]